MANPFLEKNIRGGYLTLSWGGYKGVHIFPNGISSKVNIKTLLEFEPDYKNVTVLYVRHDVA